MKGGCQKMMKLCDFCGEKEGTVPISDEKGNNFWICVWCDWTIERKDEAFEKAKARALVAGE